MKCTVGLFMLCIPALSAFAGVPCEDEFRASFTKFVSRWTDDGPMFDTRMGTKTVGDKVVGAYSAKHISASQGWKKYVAAYEERDPRTCALLGKSVKSIDSTSFTNQLADWMERASQTPTNCFASSAYLLANEIKMSGQRLVELEDCDTVLGTPDDVMGLLTQFRLANNGESGVRSFVNVDLRTGEYRDPQCPVLTRETVETFPMAHP